MRNYLSLMTVGLCLAFTGCNYTGIPVEYANMCNPANDDKYVEVVGFLDNTGSAMCSSRGKGPTECGIRFKESLTRNHGFLRISQREVGRAKSKMLKAKA